MTHRGGPLTTARGTVARQEAGRICQETSCETRLSIYNAAVLCSVHEHAMRPVLPARPHDALRRG
jgi:hypothetical protein